MAHGFFPLDKSHIRLGGLRQCCQLFASKQRAVFKTRCCVRTLHTFAPTCTHLLQHPVHSEEFFELSKGVELVRERLPLDLMHQPVRSLAQQLVSRRQCKGKDRQKSTHFRTTLEGIKAEGGLHPRRACSRLSTACAVPELQRLCG